MRNRFRAAAVVLAGCLLGTAVSAQDLDLAAGGAAAIWRSDTAGARAGEFLDQGAVSLGDTRRDLIIAAPGGAGVVGVVYVLFGGPLPTGNLSLSSAHTKLTGAAGNDLFGYSTANGNILTLEGEVPKALAIGAPGALSNRGVVYVYPGGFLHGDAFTTADATAEIRGATGDQLGRTMGTADLNNDGYRELIIGAPGNGRIYVIAGGPSLSGVIDLSTASAAITIQYPGLGHQLTAGDVTGDGVYDLILGHPSENAVHLLKGRNGSMPPAVLDMTFSGISAGDHAGAALRVADVDADGTTDLIVGAPDADGPFDGRESGGEVYLLWGGPALSGKSLQFADVTFYGPESGSRLGASLSAGNINRDTPNDLVLVGSGARGGAGDIHVYYGRPRNQIGVPRGDGGFTVDFDTEMASRRILGDTSGGTIASSLVFEVTGEGARDVIVGNPANGPSGAVYFTISPRLDLGTDNVALSGFQGIVSSSPVAVSNVSDIAITWRTSTDRPWLSATPNGSTSASTPGDVVITANGQGLAPGIHTGTVTVTSTSEHLTMSRAIEVTFEVAETQPSPSAPPVTGNPPGNQWKLFWRHASEGWLAFWEMNGITLTSTSSLSVNQMTTTAWRVAGMGDLDGNGSRDVVWQHSDGRIAAWLLTGNQVTHTGLLSVPSVGTSGWEIRGAGDTNGDRKADLIWQNVNDGRLAVWYMDGTQVTATLALSIDRMTTANWQIRAVGDTNGDGRADILWHKTDTGELAVWSLNGWIVIATSRLSIPTMTDTNWKIVGAEDVNGDRRADILWQHATGTLATWYLSGSTVTATLKLNPDRATDNDWKVAGPK